MSNHVFYRSFPRLRSLVITAAFLFTCLNALPAWADTPTPTPTPDPLLIDNFDNDASFQDGAGADARWWASDTQVFTFDNAYGVGGDYSPCLRVKFNKPAGEEWAFIAAGALTQPDNRTDFSVSHKISLHIYSAVNLLIKFRDQNGNETSDSGILPAGSANAWSTVTWDYTHIDWKQCDSKHIGDVILFVQPGQTGSGCFYLDDLTLSEPSPAPPADPNLLIDNFDNDNAAWMTASQRNANWENSNAAVYNFVMGSRVAGNDTPFLTVNYAKAAGQEWEYILANNLAAQGNRCDFSQEHLLSMHIYGPAKLTLKFRDRDGHESGDSGVLSADNASGWGSLSWDYSHINWNQCDPHQVNAILFFVQPGETGQGSFGLDNLTLGAGTPPPLLPNTSTSTPAATSTVTPTSTVTLTETETLTTTATVTPTLSVNAGPLIDNFNNDNSYNDAAGQPDAQWWASNTNDYILTMGSNLAGNSSAFLNVQYNKAAGEEWAFLAAGSLDAAGNKTDFSADHLLSMHIFGAVQLLIKFKDINGNESSDSGVLTVNGAAQWSKLTWDYANITWNQCDSHHIREILFFVQPGATGSGSFSLDNLTLGAGTEPPQPSTPTPTPTPTMTVTATVTMTPTGVVDTNPMIDNFDNDNSFNDTADQRDAQWWVSNTNDITLAMGSTLAGNTSSFLNVQYNKPAGEEWAFLAAGSLDAAGNKTDVSADHLLSMDIYGAVHFLIKFKDIHGNESGDSGILPVDSADHWSKLTWDYSNIAWNQCDPRHIREILFFIQPGATGSGSFSLDNLTLGAGSPVPVAPTLTITPTFTVSATEKATLTATTTSTAMPTMTSTVTVTTTSTAMPTMTPTVTVTTTSTAMPTMTSTFTVTTTSTAMPTMTPTFTVTTTRTPMPTSTFIPTATRTPEVKRPQQVKAWVNGNRRFIKPNESVALLGQSLFAKAAQPAVDLHFKIVRGKGLLNNAKEATALTGPAGEAATVSFKASTASWDVDLIQVNNGDLGGVAYLLIGVQSSQVRSSSNSAEPETSQVYDNEEAALAQAEVLSHVLSTSANADATATAAAETVAKGVSAYPNPAKDHVTFVWSDTGVEKACIEIFNLTGERVAEVKTETSGNSLVWNTGNVASGIYLYQTVLTINGTEERQSVKKMAVVK